MRIVFMGTPDFAVPSLEALADDHDVALVVTRPDAVRGRGRTPEPSPVKASAHARKLAVAEASRVTPGLVAAVGRKRPDLIVVAAYGAILPDALLGVPGLGTVNVHASLLPRWRGAAPVQRAVLAGDKEVGVSIMRIVHDLDAGAYCRQAKVPAVGRSAAELTDELAVLGARELAAALGDIASGTDVWTEQDAAAVTYAPKVTKAEMRLTPAEDARTNVRRVLAATDAAPARLSVGGRGVRALEAEVVDERVGAGHLLVVGRHAYLGCAGSTALELVRVRPDGRRAMGADAWAQGLRGDGLLWSEA